jgi:hypothetical protein
MLKKLISSILIVSLTLSFSACGKIAKQEVDKGTVSTTSSPEAKDSGTEKKDTSSSKKIDLGTSEGSVYKNEYFNMTITIPDKWIVATDAEKNDLIQKGKQVVAPNDKDKQKQMDYSLEKTVYLLATSEKGLAVNDTTNPNFIAIAEKLNFAQGVVVSDGKAYLEQVKKGLQGIAQIPYKFEKEIYTEKVGNKDFYVLEATASNGNVKLVQKYYATKIGDYALSFIATRYNDEQGKKLDTMIKDISFK